MAFPSSIRQPHLPIFLLLASPPVAWARSPSTMRWLVPSNQHGAVLWQLEPAFQPVLQGRRLQRDQVAFLFGDPHTVDATPHAIQAAFDGAAPIADGQEALRPEVIAEDQIPDRPHDLVSVFAGHFLPPTVVVGQVDQADLLAGPGQDLLATRTGEVLVHDGPTATSIEAA